MRQVATSPIFVFFGINRQRGTTHEVHFSCFRGVTHHYLSMESGQFSCFPPSSVSTRVRLYPNLRVFARKSPTRRRDLTSFFGNFTHHRRAERSKKVEFSCFFQVFRLWSQTAYDTSQWIFRKWDLALALERKANSQNPENASSGAAVRWAPENYAQSLRYAQRTRKCASFLQGA